MVDTLQKVIMPFGVIIPDPVSVINMTRAKWCYRSYPGLDTKLGRQR